MIKMMWEKEFYKKTADLYPTIKNLKSKFPSLIENIPRESSSLPIRGMLLSPIK